MAKKSLIFILILLLGAYPACAKEKFVKYSDAMKSLSAPDDGSISFEDVYQMTQRKEKFVLFDARPKSEYDKQRIAGAKLPHSKEYYQAEKLFKENITRERPDFAVFLKKSLASLPKDTRIVTYCNKHCTLSKVLKNEIRALGFTRVQWMDGGIDSWREKGYPLES